MWIRRTITATFLAFGMMVIQHPLSADAMAAERNVELKGTCSNPPGTVKHSGGTRVFTLKHGQKGGCSVDKKARHSAPYWERSEIRSVDFRKGRTYRFSVDVNFDVNTSSSDRTTFFQIHQFKRGSCTSCYPVVMLKTNGSGAVTAAVLMPNRHHAVKQLGLTRTQIAGTWTTFTIEMGTDDGMNPLTISANGRAVYSGQAYVEPNGAIFLRSGLYRPGNTQRTLPTDRVSIRKLRFEMVK